MTLGGGEKAGSCRMVEEGGGSNDMSEHEVREGKEEKEEEGKRDE